MQDVVWHMFKIHPYHKPFDKPLRVRICVTNEKQGIIQVMLPMLKEILPPDCWNWRADPKIMEVWTGDGDKAEIEFLTYEQDVDKFGGVSRHIVWMDEEPRLRDQYWQNMMRTLDCRGKMIMSMTPLYGITWAYDEIIDGDPDVVDYDFVSIYDNRYLPLDEIELIEKSADPELKDAILHGRFISPTGLVYKAFDETVHVIEPHDSIPKDWMILLGADTHESLRNPQAVIFMAVTPEDEFVIFDEILEHCLIPDLADMTNKKLDDWRLQGEYRFMVMDISQKSAVAGVRHDEVMQRSGLKKIRIADKTKGSPQEGRSLIKDMLKWEKGDAGEWITKPRFFVTENCVNVRREMKRYMYDEWAGKTKDKRDPKEEVRKRDDHLMDAIRYVIQENIKYRTKGFRVGQPDAKSKHLIRGVSFKSKDEVDEFVWQRQVGLK